MHTDLKIAFFGNSDFSLIVLAELARLGIVPALVVTTPDKPQGRKLTLVPTPTKTWAEENSIEYIEAQKISDPAFLEHIKPYDLFIVASYGKIIPKALIEMPKYGVLNVHPSLLPKYRGPSPLQEQILSDEKHVGVSIMLIDEAVDHGPILAQKEIAIPGWPVGFTELSLVLGRAGASLIKDILPGWVRGTVTAQAQDHGKATFTKKVQKTDGLIDLTAEGYKNYLKILAYEEWPKAYFEAERASKKIKVIVMKARYRHNTLEILEVIPEGKKSMPYADFQRGMRP